MRDERDAAARGGARPAAGHAPDRALVETPASVSPPSGAKSGSRARQRRACSGQRCSISAKVRPSKQPKPRSRRPLVRAHQRRAGGRGQRRARCRSARAGRWCRSASMRLAVQRLAPAARPAAARCAFERDVGVALQARWRFQSVSPWRIASTRVAAAASRVTAEHQAPVQRVGAREGGLGEHVAGERLAHLGAGEGALDAAAAARPARTA